MNGWRQFKDLVNAWETHTAKLVEGVLSNPLVLEPAGAWLSSVMRAKAEADKATAEWWGAIGLPTKRDQERTLHILNKLERRLNDLEEKIEAIEKR